ncbi:hypothetical protein V1525DRAFT_410059 [Lipomyces kononenkoae]|uniref:Uncharacterized protein n=1 Tax=Lipomyces kononenkoae TaxID=34357 RepID=A0ACC3SX91_LIPKO
MEQPGIVLIRLIFLLLIFGVYYRIKPVVLMSSVSSIWIVYLLASLLSYLYNRITALIGRH